MLLIGGAVVLRQPVERSIERTLVVPASPDVVFVELSDLRNLAVWPMFATRHVAGTDVIDGQTWTFVAKDDPRAELKHVRIESATRQQLKYAVGSDEHPAKWTITLAPESSGTRVTWRHDVTLYAMGKLAGLWKSFDSILAPILDEALGNLDTATRKKTPLP